MIAEGGARNVTVLARDKTKQEAIILSRLDRKGCEHTAEADRLGEKGAAGLKENAWLENRGKKAGRTEGCSQQASLWSS